MKKSIYSLILFYLFCGIFSAQNYDEDRVVDSLITKLKTEKNDTLRLILLNSISEKCADDNIWPKYNLQMQTLALQLASNKSAPVRKKARYHFGNSLINIGFLFVNRGEKDSALFYFKKGYEIMKELSNKTGLAAASNNIGYIYKSQGNIPLALDYYLSSLKYYESINDEVGIANSLNNIAIVYNKQGDSKAAIDFNLKSLALNKKLGDKRSVGITMNNLALLYCKIKGNNAAQKYLQEAIDIQTEIRDDVGVANSYNNLGYLFEENKDDKKALEYYLKAYVLLQKVNDKTVLVSNTINIGTIYLRARDIKNANDFAERSFNLAKEIGYVDEYADAAELMSKIYKQKKMYKEALAMHELYLNLKDSALNEESKRTTMQKQYQYEYEKRAAADSVRNRNEQMLKDAQITMHKLDLEKEQQRKYFLYGGIVFLIVLAGYVFYRFRNTQTKNKIIEHQKKLVDEKAAEVAARQKEIIDSITYAKRIQLALLKEEEYVSKHLPDHFILYKPKDIVSGDFYWSLEKKSADGKEHYWYLTVADCTGHGVPGAFLTLLGTSFLNEINAVPEILKPAEILNQLRDRLIKDLHQSGKIGESKDGMDMALMRLNLNTNELDWAGANQALLIFNLANELKEIKGDKQPIGFGDNISPFTNHAIQLNKGELLVMYSDGYADQFGGDKGKKYKYSNLNKFLQENSAKPLTEQRDLLNDNFEKWRGPLEQTDDVCVIGIRI